MQTESDWVLSEVIGEGSAATVYAARHRAREGDFVVKVLGPLDADDPETSGQFSEEAEASASLEHPNIVKVFDLFERDGALHLPMQRLHGQPFSGLLSGEPIEISKCVAMIRQAAEALGYAHDRGIVHRDVSTSNLFVLDDGETVKVLDFGLSRYSEATRVIRTGSAVGTPLYMAPELIEGEEGGPRSDVYALGVVFFQLLTGHLPFDVPDGARNMMDIILSIRKAQKEGLRTVGEFRPEVPLSIEDLVNRMISPEAERRPENGRVIADALTAIPASELELDALVTFPGKQRSHDASRVRTEPIAADTLATLPGGRPPPAPTPADAPTDATPPARSAPEVEAPDPFVGRTLAGRYRVERVVDRSSAAVSYGALTIVDNQPVLVKALASDTPASKALERFRREAKLFSRLSSANTVRIVNFGDLDGIPYMVLERFEGETLAARLQSGPLDEGVAINVLNGVCNALQEAHGIGVVHRSLHPKNILIARTPHGEVAKVLDFGLARLTSPDEGVGVTLGAKLTAKGESIGDARYTPPEVVQGGAFDERSDLYSLGCVAYECVAGHPPFRGAVGQVIVAQVSDPVPPLASLSPPARVSSRFEKLIMALLAKQPEDRPDSATAVRRQLDKLVLGVGADVSIPVAGAASTDRSSVVLPIAIVVIGLLAAAGWWFLGR